MTALSRRFDLDRLSLGMLLPAAAGLGAVTVALVLAWGLHTRLESIVNAQMQRYGNTVANQVASLAAEPLMAGDRLALNRIVTRLASADGILTLGVYTLDNRAVASVDEDISKEATSYSTAITFDETIAGYVRVGLDREIFQQPYEGFFTWAALISCIGVLLALAITLALRRPILRPFLALHASAGTVLRQRGEAVAESRVPTLGEFASLAGALAPKNGTSTTELVQGRPLYALVINVFNQVSLPRDERRHVLGLCRERAQKVCRLYNGRALKLTGTGVLALFDGFSDEDHAFQAICAALLTRDLVSDLNHRRLEQDRPGLLFRLALDPVSLRQFEEADDATILDALREDLQHTVLLSATARNNTVAISQAVYDSIVDPARLSLSEQRAPVLESLADRGSRWYLVEGVAESYGVLLDRQAELLLYES
ncbi:MAG: hypothetical protein P8Y95_01560 [Gammaproteobacteria bacterium]|jgi:uncharacterized membrane protein affecting hemolysin expression